MPVETIELKNVILRIEYVPAAPTKISKKKLMKFKRAYAANPHCDRCGKLLEPPTTDYETTLYRVRNHWNGSGYTPHLYCQKYCGG